MAAVFDTRVHQTRHLPTSAATRGRHLLQHLGLTVLAPAEGSLARSCRDHLSASPLQHRGG